MGEIRAGDKLVHPLGLLSVIIGDKRERIHPVTGQLVQVGTTGKEIYRLSDPMNRAWFLLAFESGKRVKHRNV